MATHRKSAFNCLVYLRLSGSVTSTDYRVVPGLTSITIPTITPDEIETTDHNAVNALKTYEFALKDPGEFSMNCILNFNKNATAVTGENPLNELQADLFDSAGSNVDWQIAVALPKSGTYATSISATPPTDRPYLLGVCRVKNASFDAPVDDKLTVEISFRVVTPFVLTRVA